MPAPDPAFPHTPSGADDWFYSSPDATPLAGRIVPADELDEAAADALANAVTACSEGRRRAARDGGAPKPAPWPIRTAGGWRNG